jgi:hypothetical protein
MKTAFELQSWYVLSDFGAERAGVPVQSRRATDAAHHAVCSPKEQGARHRSQIETSPEFRSRARCGHAPGAWMANVAGKTCPAK